MGQGELAQMILRMATAADDERCAEIFLAGRRQSSAGEVADRFRLRDYEASVAGEEVWVAEVGGRVVGFVSVASAENLIHHLFIDGDWQNRGIGRALLGFIHSRMAGVAHLECSVNNRPARIFYERNGWTPDGQIGFGGDSCIRYRKAAEIDLRL